jgi:hypothetical protein
MTPKDLEILEALSHLDLADVQQTFVFETLHYSLLKIYVLSICTFGLSLDHGTVEGI